ncbi:MAG TPA: TonB family protein [Candidatus Angelobacter sp.]|nr:TonB family protein [Candidatus Angelobacter sp.]
MKVARLAVVLLLAGVLAPAVLFAAAQPEKQTITFEGKERIYYIFVPEKLAAAPEKPATPAPLLLLLHGSGNDGMSQIEQWQDLAKQEGLVLVAPNSLNSSEWNMPADGPEFLHAVVEAVQGKYPIDGKRIYLFGHSAGAMFALQMGVMESQYFAAAGVHASATERGLYFTHDLAKRKLPLAIWVGTEDPDSLLTLVRNTQKALEERGFDAQVFKMEGHDHDYYAVAKDLNPKIWSFLSASSLDADAKWQTYPFRFAEPKRLRVSSGVVEKLKVHVVQPEYPEAARKNNISGDVLLKVLIGQEGRIAELTLVSGDPLLAESAIKAVKQWEYRPYILNGKPVEVETTIKVQFHM